MLKIEIKGCTRDLDLTLVKEARLLFLSKAMHTTIVIDNQLKTKSEQKFCKNFHLIMT